MRHELHRQELEDARSADPTRFEEAVQRYHQRALEQPFSTPLNYARFERRSARESYFRTAAWMEVERRLGGKPDSTVSADADEDDAPGILDDVKRLVGWVRRRLGAGSERR